MNAEKVSFEISRIAGLLLMMELVLCVLRECPNVYHPWSDFPRRNIPFEITLRRLR